ncbi:MAG: hypothetical protein LW730_02845 [Xanthomonadaceae bacterium]|jgi:hypothetical protein|nr:hypothetical protein [Xanthomonadaceae bacterium]
MIKEWTGIFKSKPFHADLIHPTGPHSRAFRLSGFRILPFGGIFYAQAKGVQAEWRPQGMNHESNTRERISASATDYRQQG